MFHFSRFVAVFAEVLLRNLSNIY